MRMTERVTLSVIFGAVPICICFVAGWWISIPLVPESLIPLCALAVFFVGVVVDILFLSTWVRHAYSMKPIVWMSVYLVYSVGMFGFFMGVPLFHVALAFPAGCFVGGWLVHRGADSTRMKKAAKDSAAFTTSVLAIVCVASAAIALASPSTGADLQGMLRLPFQVTPVMIMCLILGGGLSLLLLQWWLTLKSVELAYGYFAVRTSSSISA